MTGSRPANPAIRRLAVAALLAVTLAGALSIGYSLRIEQAIQAWIVADPQAFIHRIKVVIVLAAMLILLPLFACSWYFWKLGARIVRDQEFPPGGYGVLKDTPVITGPKALFRGRVIKILGVCLGSASILLGLLFWTMACSTNG